MYNRDYSKEVGLDSGEKIVPLRYLIPILALVAVLGWFGTRSLMGDHPGDHRSARQSQATTHS
jgi:hypothetical protein